MLVVLATMVCFSSCTKNPERLIVGKWKVVSARCSDNNVKPWVIDAISNDKGETWSFKENGTFVGYMNLLSLQEIDELGYGDVECDYICDDNTIEGRGGNLRGITDYGETRYDIVFTFEIDEISKNELSITGKITVTWTSFDYEESETETVTKIKYELEKKEQYQWLINKY